MLDGCFLSDKFLANLQAAGTDVTLELRTMHDQSSITPTAVQCLIVMDWIGQHPLTQPTYSGGAEIPLSPRHNPRPEILIKMALSTRRSRADSEAHDRCTH